MAKAKIIQKRTQNSDQTRNNPFLINMSYAFQHRENLYLIIDLLTDGDLRFHLVEMRRFSEAQTKFFEGYISLSNIFALTSNYSQRLKTRELVLEDDGYMRLTDLGIARNNNGNNAGNTSGTLDYMAHEVMCRIDHSIVAENYELGVITYELMIECRPYNGRTIQDIRKQILVKQYQDKLKQLILEEQNYYQIIYTIFINCQERKV